MKLGKSGETGGGRQGWGQDSCYVKFNGNFASGNKDWSLNL